MKMWVWPLRTRKKELREKRGVIQFTWEDSGVKGLAVGRSGLAKPGAGAGAGAGKGSRCWLESNSIGGWGVEAWMRSRHKRGLLKVQ